ncbi:hypothetical protein M011DRAFT_463424 [Sporormia fimetaria CBS 119925]|uniref:DUF3431 domain-containing protein n=1 Tax=Sporormia fimetaria CBS 119925 TaxID=1340428 RepID=A0A6A6VQR3_9PLEO|nr:hypothetical protein M011DRAFT_463424 [Sporormia fimetaria CBS 119925]
MLMRSRLPLLAIPVALIFIAVYYSTSIRTSFRETWRDLPQHIGLGDHADTPGAGAQDPDFANWNPRPDFKKGSPMPGDHNYTSTLVIAKIKKEDVAWIDRELPGQQKAVYVADDPTAPLHTPKNKGHEVMVYLTYIIDNYRNLPDVSIFMHAHQTAWHNDDILGFSAPDMVRRLNRARVWREGYINMRCNWGPGCPDWMRPGETKENPNKHEEVLLAKAWSELFPLDKVPEVLAQPCCAQFALSRERIQALPHAMYVWYRNWLLNTRLPDRLSGRVWEYVWQFVFTGQNKYCPAEYICFCDQYGSCFGGKEKYEEFTKLKKELGDREHDLDEWKKKKKQLEKPEPGKDKEFTKEIDRLRPIVDKLKDEARKRGDDPQNRAKELGREWHEGNGF